MLKLAIGMISFTPEERDNYIAEGITMESLLGPQYMAVVGPNAWNDTSIQPDDPWLLENYVFVDDCLKNKEAVGHPCDTFV